MIPHSAQATERAENKNAWGVAVIAVLGAVGIAAVGAGIAGVWLVIKGWSQ